MQGNHHRGSAAVGWRGENRINLKRWRALRMAQFDAAGWRCVKCGKGGHLELDHITPLHIDPLQDAYSVSGTQVMCRPCHFSTSRRAERYPAQPGTGCLEGVTTHNAIMDMYNHLQLLH